MNHALTEREIEVVRAAALGAPYKAIGAKLGITRNTVETHMVNIHRKFGLHSVGEVISYRGREAVRAWLLLLLTMVAARADLSVTLAWDRNPEPDIREYHLHYGHASGIYPWTTNAGNATNVTVSGLVEATNYCFVVTAINTAGMESDFSNEVSYQVPAKPSPPRSLHFLATPGTTNQTEKLVLHLQGANGAPTGWRELGSLAVTNPAPTNQVFYQGWLEIKPK